MLSTFFNWRMIGSRSVEIPWLFKNLKDGSILDIGSVGAFYNSELKNQERDLALVDTRKGEMNIEGIRIKIIQQDVRKVSPDEIGKFDNVLLISTLEHIGLTAYDSKADWKDSPALEQLRTFNHCMDFLKDDGRMLLTLPYGKYRDKGWLLVYDKEMIKNIKGNLKVIGENYFTLEKSGEGYVECKEEECPLISADYVPAQGRAVSVVCLVLMR